MATTGKSRKPLVVLAALAVVALLCWRFPLFHVVPLGQAREEAKAAVFDAAAFAGEFWDSKLLPATAGAVGLTELLGRDEAARVKHGRSLGMGGATLYFVKGEGRVTAVEEDQVRVTVDGTAVDLETGLLFGNTVRDASGLLDVSAFPDSGDFNDISTRLNEIVESRVTPALRENAAAGKAIRFAGCFEWQDDATPRIIPLKVEWP